MLLLLKCFCVVSERSVRAVRVVLLPRRFTDLGDLDLARDKLPGDSSLLSVLCLARAPCLSTLSAARRLLAEGSSGISSVAAESVVSGVTASPSSSCGTTSL